MRVITAPQELRAACDEARALGAVAVVPTMGALHRGHAALIEAAAKRARTVVVTVFVNPTQFGPAEDFARYPRTLDADVALARAAGASLVFAPSADAMYPAGDETRVHVGATAAGLCGAHRPGHFEGVATIVAKLLSLVGRSIALFGRKDLPAAARHHAQQVQFLQDKIGQTFEAMVSGVTEFGFFAELEGNKCEGMVHVRNLKDDRYVFEAESYRLRGVRSGNTISLGDKLHVKIKSADLIKKQIDFELVDFQSKATGTTSRRRNDDDDEGGMFHPTKPQLWNPGGNSSNRNDNRGDNRGKGKVQRRRKGRK